MNPVLPLFFIKGHNSVKPPHMMQVLASKILPCSLFSMVDDNWLASIPFSNRLHSRGQTLLNILEICEVFLTLFRFRLLQGWLCCYCGLWNILACWPNCAYFYLLDNKEKGIKKYHLMVKKILRIG